VATKDLVLVIDKPQFVVKLHKNLLEVDLKKGAMKELEDVLEAKPILRESLGFLFQTAVPLDIPLKDIDSVSADEKGRVKIVIPFRKDILIPLDKKEANRLVSKLNELIPIEKQKHLESLLAAEKAAEELEPRRAEMYEEVERERFRPG
jgi:hypothetical protein